MKPYTGSRSEPWLGAEGLWRIRVHVFLAQSATGKQLVRTKTCAGETKEAAGLEADKFVVAIRDEFSKTGAVAAPFRETLAAYGRRWLDARKPRGQDDDLKLSTWHGYDETWRTYVEAADDPKMPQLGRIPMERLRAEHVQDLYSYLHATPDGRGQLRWGRARVLHAVLRQVLKAAYATKTTTDNLPAQLLGAFGRRQRRPRKVQKAYTGEQLAAFLKAADTDRYRAFWYMFAFTGMRPSELLALSREDVDLAGLKVSVSKRLRELPARWRTSPDEKWDIDEPKTENSIHDVELPRELVPILERHIGGGGPATEKARKRWSRSRWGRLLFQTASGQPVSWYNLRKNYERICRRAKLGTFGEQPAKPEGQSGPPKQSPFKPLLKPYALRHTHATLSIEDGVPLEVVSDRLGHSDTAFTSRTYVDTRPSRQRLAADAADKRLKALTGGVK